MAGVNKLLDKNSNIIAQEYRLNVEKVVATITLLDEGNTIPFVARYRKEVTGEMNEEQIRNISERIAYLRNLDKRREEIMASIASQEKLTPELEASIQACYKLQELEDLYLPYKPKKRTRAMIAKEKGLQPVADMLLEQKLSIEELIAATSPFLSEEHAIIDEQIAWTTACDIIAEQISDNARFRDLIRKEMWRNTALAAEWIEGSEFANDFLNYKDFQKHIKLIPPHQTLAINRGETKEALKIKLIHPNEQIVKIVRDNTITNEDFCKKDLLENTINDALKRLIIPALERELRTELTARAERQAISVFARNLKQLLLQAPLQTTGILGLDPGYRTGCKVAAIDNSGKVLDYSTVYLTHSADQRTKAKQKIADMIKKHNLSLISIGNGTASYETEEAVAEIIQENSLNVQYIITNEAGASVYSASKLATAELPDLDVTIRGAVSIARRVQDPLAELVKIEPKAIGVGQYQHDVNQKDLVNSLSGVVESCVNHVGVELNTASAELLTYVAGIQASVAKNIVIWRDENGPFKNRKQLTKVPRLGPAAFTQAAGFLRIKESEHPLDNTPIHPESYDLANDIIKLLGVEFKGKLKELPVGLPQIAATADAQKIADSLGAGLPTVRDILQALAKPGRDPRADMPAPLTRKNITKLSDLKVGSVVEGTIHNVTDFGVFVDIGIKTNGLIHKSELSHRRFAHPLDIVSVGDIIKCVIINIDEQRNRIGLSLKQVPVEGTVAY